MSKTFWSVEYNDWGMEHTANKWFNDKTAAEEFSAGSFKDGKGYRGKVVRHTYRDDAAIQAVTERIAEQERYM